MGALTCIQIATSLDLCGFNSGSDIQMNMEIKDEEEEEEVDSFEKRADGPNEDQEGAGDDVRYEYSDDHHMRMSP